MVLEVVVVFSVVVLGRSGVGSSNRDAENKVCLVVCELVVLISKKLPL